MKYRKIISCLLACVMLSGLTSCGQSSQDLSASARKQEIQTIDLNDDFRTAQMQFAWKLFQNTCAEHESENVLLSPLSVMLALSMTACGADNQTKSQMEQVLGSELDTLNQALYSYVHTLPSSQNAKLSLANSIWFRDTLAVNPEFVQTDANYYHAGLYQENFSRETCDKINAWVKKNTDNMIDNVINEISPDTMMYLINALAFDAKWRDPYQKTDIHEREFTNADGTSKTVSMMHSTELNYLESEHMTGFTRPYKDGYSFAALLPEEGLSIDDCISSLDAETLSAMLNTVRICPEEVSVMLPEFKGTFSTSMKETLSGMGMPDAFTENADFSGISETPLFIDDILHQTYIEVDANGTKAAAVSTVIVKQNKAEAVLKSVILDRPFIYMIIDNENKLPVFIGTVRNIET